MKTLCIVLLSAGLGAFLSACTPGGTAAVPYVTHHAVPHSPPGRHVMDGGSGDTGGTEPGK